jgi:hypothetical protein
MSMNDSISLKDVNELLTKNGFQAISPQQAQLIGAQGSPCVKERFISAVQKLGYDQGAREYVKKGLNYIGMREQELTQSPVPQHGQNPVNQAHHKGPAPMQTSTARTLPNNTPHHPQQGPEGMPGPQDDNASQHHDRLSFHVYGGKAALCFESDMTKNEFPTVAMDAAISTSPRQYDWGNKVRIQMTKAELPAVLAVLLGSSPSCEFKSHGPQKDKGFSMERQGPKVFIKVFAKDQGVKAVPVEASDVFYITTLFIRQLQKSMPWMDSNAIVQMLGSSQAAAIPSSGQGQRQGGQRGYHPQNGNPQAGHQQHNYQQSH